MLLFKNISELIVLNFKIHPYIATPLFKVSDTNPIRLSVVSKTTEKRYILKGIACFIFCLFQWIQIVNKASSFQFPQIILSLLVNVSISFHFVVLIFHYKNRHQIVNLFNNFVAFETRYNGKTHNFDKHKINLYINST